jgi:cold shock CspA family protein/ribosome-associated translation inhibitor RaiA
MDLQIRTQHTDLDPMWRHIVEHAAQRFGERYPELLRMHVTLRHGRHRHGTEAVTVLANTAHRAVSVSKEGEEVPDALHAALGVLEEELDRYHRERRRVTKSPNPRLQGVVTRIFRDSGYGFILLDRGVEVYFHRHSLDQLKWNQIHPGMPVEIQMELGREGPQAARVCAIGQRGAA